MKIVSFLLVIVMVLAFQFVVMAKDKNEPSVVLQRNSEGLVQYQETVEIPGVGASVLFSRAKNWATNAFVSVKDTLQNEDVAGGRLTYKGILIAQEPLGIKRPVRFTLTIEIKDGKARITLVSFKALYGEFDQIEKGMEELLKPDSTPKSVYSKLVTSIDEKAKLLIEEAKAGLAKPEENW